MEENQHPAKKHFSEEETLEKVEKKIDTEMDKIMKQGFVRKFQENKLIKDILHSKIVHEANEKIKEYVRIIFIVIWWIALASGIIGLFSFLISLSWLGFRFSFWFGIWLRVILYIILALAFSLLALFTGIGMIRMKKRVLALIILWFFVSVLSLILSFFPVGLVSYRSYWNFWSAFFNLILTFVLTMLVLKNEHLLKE